MPSTQFVTSTTALGVYSGDARQLVRCCVLRNGDLVRMENAVLGGNRMLENPITAVIRCLAITVVFLQMPTTTLTAAWKVKIGPTNSFVTAGMQSGRTIWEGVYTKEQAERGRVTYRRACMYCHLPDLTGGSNAAAPALAGERFLAKWDGRPLSDLFVKMAETMPKDATEFGGDPPAAVKLEAYLDLVAFVLMFNEVPSGHTELPADERLETIVITRQP